MEGVSKCCGYWVLTFLSACHRQDGLFWVNTANNSRRLICRGCCSLNLGTVWLLTLPSCSISPCVSMLFCNYYCQASVLPCQLFGRAQLITDIEAASQKEKNLSCLQMLCDIFCNLWHITQYKGKTRMRDAHHWNNLLKIKEMKSWKWPKHNSFTTLHILFFDSVRPQSHRPRDRFLTIWQPPDIWAKNEYFLMSFSMLLAVCLMPIYVSQDTSQYHYPGIHRSVGKSGYSAACWQIIAEGCFLLLEWNWSECSVALKSSLQFLWSLTGQCGHL